jgi:opacity protein-like surface antigen
VHHHYYGNSGGGGGGSAQVNTDARPDLPDRKVNRNDTFMVGVHGANYISGYDNGGGFRDPGVGLTIAYRPVETFGVEFQYSYFNPTLDRDSATPRETATMAPSLTVHAFPWKRVSPYAAFGVTGTRRNYDDSYTVAGETMSANVQSTAWGPHAGLGLELALGDNLAVDLEGRYVGYVNVEDDPNAPAALQATAGLNFYF